MPVPRQMISDLTFKAMIESDFKQISERTAGRIYLVGLDAENNEWRVRHNGSATMMDDAEVAAFSMGVLAALNAREDMTCGKDFIAGEKCILPSDHSGGHVGAGV